MSASLNTFIEPEGTLKEIKAMIAAIKGYNRKVTTKTTTLDSGGVKIEGKAAK